MRSLVQRVKQTQGHTCIMKLIVKPATQQIRQETKETFVASTKHITSINCSHWDSAFSSNAQSKLAQSLPAELRQLGPIGMSLVDAIVQPHRHQARYKLFRAESRLQCIHNARYHVLDPTFQTFSAEWTISCEKFVYHRQPTWNTLLLQKSTWILCYS